MTPEIREKTERMIKIMCQGNIPDGAAILYTEIDRLDARIADLEAQLATYQSTSSEMTMTDLEYQIWLSNHATRENLITEIYKLKDYIRAMPTEPWRPLKEEDKDGRLLLAKIEYQESRSVSGYNIIQWSEIRKAWSSIYAYWTDRQILAVAKIKEIEP